MATIRSEFKKTPDQVAACEIMSGPARHVLLFGGSRSGKTMIIVRAIVLRAVKSPYSRHCILRRHYCDVRKSVLMDTFPKLMRIGFPGLDYKENKQTSVISFSNGSEIWFGGLDKTDKILGNEYATMFFNEISEIGFEQLEVAQSRLAQKCPALVNRFFYDCNPPSKSHWSYKMFALKQNPNDNTPLPNPALYGWKRLNPDGNKENLADGYISDVLGGLSGRNRKRFLDGEWLDDNENALWKRESMINPYRISGSPIELDRIVVGVDPAVTQKDVSDHTGIVIAGCKRMRGDVHYFVLDDRSLIGSPHEWAATAVNAYHEYEADRMVAETNQGGDMVEQTIRNIDRNISYKSVRASRGKIVRAEPIAELYERGLVHHVGEFPAMEDEMCEYCGFENEKSPDRMDALVWALTELSQRGIGSRAILAN
ncbi:MAG: phage terminase large subunit [Victivallaceae bacterium]|nr:phage terminase large subunit [Victivallaceae bacterium]